MVRIEHHGLNLKVRSTGIHTGILRDSCRQKPTSLESILHSSHTSWRTSLEITWPNLWLPFRLKSSSVFSKIQMIGTECDTGMAFFLVTQRDKTQHLFCDTFIHCVTIRICDGEIADWYFDEVSENGHRILKIEFWCLEYRGGCVLIIIFWK